MKYQKWLKITFQETCIKIIHWFIFMRLGRKEPSQTCSQERDYQKYENNMKQRQIPHEYHSSRLTTFVSYLWKSGFQDRTTGREFALMNITRTTGTSKAFCSKAIAHLRAKTKYKMVLEVMIQIQLKVTFTKCLLCIKNCSAFIWPPVILLITLKGKSY